MSNLIHKHVTCLFSTTQYFGLNIFWCWPIFTLQKSSFYWQLPYSGYLCSKKADAFKHQKSSCGDKYFSRVKRNNDELSGSGLVERCKMGNHIMDKRRAWNNQHTFVVPRLPDSSTVYRDKWDFRPFARNWGCSRSSYKNIPAKSAALHCNK